MKERRPRSSSRARVSVIFLLGLLWLLFDIGRPPTPSGVPLLISAALFVDWLFKRDKQWTRQTVCWFVFLAVMAAGILFAPNTYAAALLTRLMTVLILGICLPIQAMITSVAQLRLWIYWMIGISVFVGAWAATHGGFGPAGTDGQDENYVAALMAMATSLAYFSIFAERRLIPRILLVASISIFVAAIVVAHNPSRGGFLALCAVALYGVARSPHRVLGFGVMAVAGLALLVIAGPTFWAEIGTTTDIRTGTGDTRLELWSAGMRMWMSNPILGVGPGNFLWTVGNYQTIAQLDKFGHSLTGVAVAHSLPVECVAELGTVGAGALVALVWFTWRDLGRVAQRKLPRGVAPSLELIQLRCYADAMRGAILGIGVAGVFLSLLYYSHLWVLLAAGSAVPFVARRVYRNLGRAQLARGRPGREGRGIGPPLPLAPLGSGSHFDRGRGA